MKPAYFGQCSCCIDIDKHNYPEERELDTNPILTLARILTLSTGKRNFGHFTFIRRYDTTIFNFAYTNSPYNLGRDPESRSESDFRWKITIAWNWRLGNRYEVRDLFPWKMTTKMIISCLLNVKKIWNSAQINLCSTWIFYRIYFYRSNNIHREIDQWNRHRFGTKWNVTVPNSVTPVKPIVCKWICMSLSNVVKWHTNYMYIKLPSAFSWNYNFEQFL